MAVIGGSYVKVPAALIPSTLVDFVHKIDLSTLTDSFWTSVDAAGAFIRVRDAAGSNLPFDLLAIDKTNRRGVLFFKGTLTAGQVNEYRIVVDDAVTAPLVTDPLGRNAVWSAYDCFFAGSAPTVNRTGAATVQSSLSANSAYTFGYEALSVPLNVHQGVAFDGTHFYVTDNNFIGKYDKDWNLVASNGNPLAAHKAASGYTNLNHLGDCTIKDGELFIVSEEYTNSPYDTQIIAVHNIADLSFNRMYDISAQLHEVSSICWDATNGYFVVTDYTSAGSSVLHKYSATGVYLGTISTPSLTSKQGIEYYDGKFYVMRAGGAFQRLNLDGTGLETLVAQQPNGTPEGLCSLGDGSFAVLFDGTPSALYRAVPNAKLAEKYPTFFNTTEVAPFRCVGLPKRTQWTVGISLVPTMHSGNSSFLSYSDNSTSNSNRATLAIRDYYTWGAWNSTDGWLNFSDLTEASNTIGIPTRVNYRHDGTTKRETWRRGRLETTDLDVSQRPAATGDTLFIACEDTSVGERYYGLLNFIYLRDGLLSEDWLRTESRSWQEDTLYGVSDVSQADADFAALDQIVGTDTDPTVGAPGWTKMSGISAYSSSTRGSGIGPAFGDRFFRCDAAAWTRARQMISVASHGARIDNGDVVAVMNAVIASDFVDPDRGKYELRFFNGSGDLIKSAPSRWRRTDPAGVWSDESLRVAVPRGTRAIERRMEAWRNNGTDLNIAFDIESLTLQAPEVGTPPEPSGRRRNVSMMIG